MTPFQRRLRITILHPYWSLWEHTASPAFRTERMRLVREVSEQLTGVADIVSVEEIASEADGLSAGARAAASATDVFVILQTMAVPPSYVLACLDAVPGVSVVIWALHVTGLVSEEFDHGAITAEGATVGAPMLSNILVRRDTPFELVLGRASDDAVLQRTRDAIRNVAAASSLKRARVGRVGRPLEGYLHVDVDPGSLQEATGITLVSIDPDEVVERYRSADPSRIRALDEDVRTNWTLDDDIDMDESLARSLRAAIALEDIVRDHRLDGGAFNCHVRQFRFGREIGIAPCWGLGRLTSMGIPWSCTGDVLTAVAMLTTKRLGGAALYHEIETIDYATGEVIIANSGEHDLAWGRPGERPRLVRNGWFCGKDPRCGVCALLSPPLGPATLVGFTPHPRARGGFRYIVARGELTSRQFPATGTCNGAFRFGSGPVESAWSRWVAAGVNHHSSATPGDLAAGVMAVAHHLGVDAVEV